MLLSLLSMLAACSCSILPSSYDHAIHFHSRRTAQKLTSSFTSDGVSPLHSFCLISRPDIYPGILVCKRHGGIRVQPEPPGRHGVNQCRPQPRQIPSVEAIGGLE